MRFIGGCHNAFHQLGICVIFSYKSEGKLCGMELPLQGHDVNAKF